MLVEILSLLGTCMFRTRGGTYQQRKKKNLGSNETESEKFVEKKKLKCELKELFKNLLDIDTIPTF